MPLTVDVDSLF